MKRSFRWLCILLVICQLLTMLGCKNTEKEWQDQYDLGRRYMSEGNYEEAILAFMAAIEIDPKNPDGYLFLAKAYERSGDPEKALEVLEWGYDETDDEDIQEEIEELEEELEELEELEDRDEKSEDQSDENVQETDDQPQAGHQIRELINNGGLSVSDGENSYYWSYSDAEAGFVLIWQDASGNETELFQGNQTKLYLYRDRIYLNQHNDEGGNNLIEINPRNGDLIETVSFGEVLSIDEKSGKFLVRDGNAQKFYIVDILTKERMETAVDSSVYRILACKDGKAYYSYSPDSARDTAELWMLDLMTGEAQMISSATVDNFQEFGSNAYVTGVQITDDAIYYGCGCIAGTGTFFQPGGKLVRVSLADYSSEVLDDFGDSINYDDGKFYVFEQDGVEYILYTNASGEYNSLMNLSTREVTQTDMVVGYLGIPAMGYDGSGSYWVYPEADGQIIQVLPGLNSDGYSYYNNISYTGRYVFYEIVYQEENPNPNSWRDYMVPYKSEFYVCDLETGTASLLSIKEY